MSDHDRPAGKGRDIYSEITSQLVAAIEADPGCVSAPNRGSDSLLMQLAD